VRRAIRKSGIESPTFWQIREHLPKETRDYVPLYIATTIITMKRDKYGFSDDSVDLHEPYDYETVKIEEPVNFSTLATCGRVSIDSLRKLNPELVRDCTPPSGAYELKVYPGMAADFLKRYAALSDDDKQVFIKHAVVRGETLASIAGMYGTTAGELAEINGLSGYRARLKGGMSLRVPVRGGRDNMQQDVARAVAGQSQQTSQSKAATDTTKNAVPAAETSPEKTIQTGATGRKERVAAIHVVERGDNLSSISSKYNIRLMDLRNWNDIPYDKDNLRVGDTLIVGTPSGVTRRSAVPEIERLPIVQTKIHKVRRGETLASIARSYQLAPERLAKINNLAGRKLKVKAGQRLKVEVKTTTTTPQRQQAAVQQPKKYKVRKGDTLAGIADKFNTTIAAIKKRNPALKRTNALRAGQVVYVD